MRTKVQLCGVDTSSLPIIKHEEMMDKFRALQAGNESIREELVTCNLRLVLSLVGRFAYRSEQADELFQVGCIGLLKSVDKFDLSYNVKFSTYAVPMIIGEIQRFIRDDGTVKVSRSLKEMSNKIRRVKDELSKQFGRTPTITEISEHLEVSPEEIIMAQEASRSPSSIHETVYENDGDPITLLDQIADSSETKWFEKIALKEAIALLDEREKLIVYLRYYKDQTQTEVAERLGISQVQVSRLEKKILNQMKDRMD